MPALESPRSLHEHLRKARVHLDRGETAEALVLVEAALAADPGFLAARALLELIQSPGLAGPTTTRALQADLPHPSHDAAASEDMMGPSAAMGVLAIEQRARQRRMARRLESMRRALAAGRVDEARTALEEARGIDQRDAAIVLASAELKLHEARGMARPRTTGAAIALWFAAVVLGGVWVASQWLDMRSIRVPSQADQPESSDSVPPARPEPSVAALPPADSAPPRKAALSRPRDPSTSLSRDERVREPSPLQPQRPPARTAVTSPTARLPLAAPSRSPAAPAAVRAPERSATAPPLVAEVQAATAPTVARVLPIPPTQVAAAPTSLTVPSDGPRAAEVPTTTTTAAVPALVPPPAALPSTSTGAMEDERLVRQILQRYEAAYEALDARSAQGVWPAVNADALARAFADLSAQELRFDECGVDIRGNAAVATCRGFVRYVPKVGRQAPRMDSRQWTFALEKEGPRWLIASARTTAR